MRNSYFDYDSRAIIDLSDMWDGMCVNRVNVPEAFRGKGIMRSLMAKCLEDADRENVTLYLGINPYGNLTYEELEAWYLRLGFEHHSTEEGWYVRKPKLHFVGVASPRRVRL